MYSPLNIKVTRKLRGLGKGEIFLEYVDDESAMAAYFFNRDQNITEAFDAVIMKDVKRFCSFSEDDPKWTSTDTLYTEFYLYD